MTQQTLEAFGYEVLTAADGADALRMLRDRATGVDVVVTDMTMPRMDGAELVGALRDVDPAIPVVAVRGMGAAAAEASADLRVDGHLAKPYTAEELLDAIGRALASRRRGAEGER